MEFTPVGIWGASVRPGGGGGGTGAGVAPLGPAVNMTPSTVVVVVIVVAAIFGAVVVGGGGGGAMVVVKGTLGRVLAGGSLDLAVGTGPPRDER